jgi:hypothetical protein
VKHFERIQSFLDCDLDKMPRSLDAAAMDIPFPRPLPGHIGFSRVRHVRLYTRECGNRMCPRKTYSGPKCIDTCLIHE